MILGFVVSWMHSDKSRQSVVWLYTRYFFSILFGCVIVLCAWPKVHAFCLLVKPCKQTEYCAKVLSHLNSTDHWQSQQLVSSQTPRSLLLAKSGVSHCSGLSLETCGKKNTYNIVILGVAGQGRPTTTDALFKSNLVHLVSRKLKVRLQSAPLLAQAAVASLTARSVAFSIYLGTSKLPLLLHLKQNHRMLDCAQGTSSMVTPDLVANGLRPRRQRWVWVLTVLLHCLCLGVKIFSVRRCMQWYVCHFFQNHMIGSGFG